MKHLNLFIELTRLKKPIGFMLLFWPCAWGLTIASDFKNNFKLYFFYLTLFFLGSVLMRSAGCIVNDIFDKDLDQKVFRTKNRPIATGEVSIKIGIFYSCILCLLAFFVLLNFNFLTIILAIGSMPLAFLYPLMKRFTYWPQLFLGITFNYGLILGYVSVAEKIELGSIIFYLGAIFWTLGYDTIYGFQDVKDDEIIGIKSTSIKFKTKSNFILKIFYSFFSFSLIIVGIITKLNFFYFLIILLATSHMFLFQIKKIDINNSNSCLKMFKSNNFLGLIIFVAVIIGKL